jgi:hypothetical protein
MWEEEGRLPRDLMDWLYGVRLEVKMEVTDGEEETGTG